MGVIVPMRSTGKHVPAGSNGLFTRPFVTSRWPGSNPNSQHLGLPVLALLLSPPFLRISDGPGKMDPLRAQMSIKRNMGEVHDVVRDLYAWEDEMTTKEKGGRQRAAPSLTAPLPPVRGSRPVSMDRSATAAASLAASPQDVDSGVPGPQHPPIKPRNYDEYYKWEAFDVDKALAEGETAAPSVPAAKPRPTGIVETPRSQEQQSNTFKEEGNALYKAGSFLLACAKYSEAIALSEKNAVLFSNRAMCHLKLGRFADAERDASEAIRLDATMVKALHRRATARKEQGNCAGAVSDLEAALLLEPSNTQIHQELVSLRSAVPPPPSLVARSPASAAPTRIDEPIVATAAATKRKKLQIQENDEDAVGAIAAPAALETAPSAPVKPSQDDVVVPLSKSVDDSKESRPAEPRPIPMFKPELPKEPPQTAYEFERLLKAFRNDLGTLGSYILGSVDLSRLPALLSHSFDAEKIALMAESSLLALKSSGKEFVSKVIALMQSLTLVPRFATVCMLLSKAQKKTVTDLFLEIDACHRDDCSVDLVHLRKQFRIN